VYVLIGIALVLGLLGCSLVVATKRVFVIDDQNAEAKVHPAEDLDESVDNEVNTGSAEGPLVRSLRRLEPRFCQMQRTWMSQSTMKSMLGCQFYAAVRSWKR